MAKKKRDAGSQTNPDAKMVNALESDPEFFKDPLKGKTLGKCKIQKLIGEGRTSVVYQAMYEPLKRTVAVKVLQQGMTKYPAVVKVFQQEGRAVAALDHENVLKIYDVGKQGNYYYLVLELLRGRELLARIEEEVKLDVDEALGYIAQAARGLAAAHRKNLVHRDIKPQNLVIEPDGKLKIVDFGLAAEAEGAFSGGRLGTPHYMSPEQCRGEHAGTASDIYALGITLFHALIGHAPFAGSKTTDEIIEKHLAGDRLEPEALRKGIPRAVGELVRRMTRMRPDQRPTAQEVYEAITQGLQTKQRTRTRGRVRRARAKESQPPVALAAIGGAIVIAIIAFFLMSGDDDEKQQDEIVQAPPPVTKKEPEKEKEPEVKIERKLKGDIEQLIDEAKREERTGNLREAHVLWTRVLKKAPAESRFYKEALAAKKGIEKRLKAEKNKKRVPRSYITVSASEKAGKEFAEKEDEFRKRITDFDLKPVREEMEALRKRTREATAERSALELALERLKLIESLFSVMTARAGSLDGAKQEWSSYDIMADPDLLVIGASARGIEVQVDDSAVTKHLAWSTLEPTTRISFLEALRNPKSGTETMWLGYYCQLLEDPRSDQYYEYATMNDNSPEMRTAIKELRGK